MTSIPAEDVTFMLMHLGLDRWQAEQAASDPLLPPWDTDGVARCLRFIRGSKAGNPVALLWLKLSRDHALPNTDQAPNIHLVTEAGPYLCPVCHEDMAVCYGMHGWAAKYRGMAPGEIYQPPDVELPGLDERPMRPRRTRRGRNTT